ncbi:7-deoxyloganetic acid glucosyltransferase [Camellia lanceoleosa]|uniref:7-deoxyloganetic acid glucosyltransferase n=1 Tax=Camellia lanceoleosa TaxID=1840588 RepID=A0ACC0IV97_9ERIC|nr:7-deoxyloganetic acid glucosyltransferase [Camellia lanceoleosa]
MLVEVDCLRSFDYEREVIGATNVVVEEVVVDVVCRSLECIDGDDHFMDKRRVEVAATNEVVHSDNVESRGGNEHVDEGIVMNGMKAFCDMSDGGKSGRIGVGEVGFGGIAVCDVSPLRVVAHQSGISSDVAADEMTDCRSRMARGDYIISISESEVQDVPDVVECVASLGGKHSLVCNIKNNVRREQKMVEFDYPLLAGRTKKIVVNIGGVVINAYAELLKTEQLRKYGDDNLADKSYFFNSVCLGVPGMENILCRRDLPSFCRSSDLDDPSMKLIVKEVEQIPLGFGLILNTFEEPEEPILSHIRSLCPNLYPIGPLHAHLKTRLGAAEPKPRLPLASSNSLWQEDRICMTWLDAQPPKSVIYVTIGSLAMMTSDQGMELARFGK